MADLIPDRELFFPRTMNSTTVSTTTPPPVSPPDSRYTVTREHTGRTTPCFVARFCGDWLDRRDSYEEAVALCNAFHRKRTFAER